MNLSCGYQVDKIRGDKFEEMNKAQMCCVRRTGLGPLMITGHICVLMGVLLFYVRECGASKRRNHGLGISGAFCSSQAATHIRKLWKGKKTRRKCAQCYKWRQRAGSCG